MFGWQDFLKGQDSAAQVRLGKASPAFPRHDSPKKKTDCKQSAWLYLQHSALAVWGSWDLPLVETYWLIIVNLGSLLSPPQLKKPRGPGEFHSHSLYKSEIDTHQATLLCNRPASGSCHMFAPVRNQQNQAWSWHLDSDTMEYDGICHWSESRLCNHPADFSVRMVDYSKWDKLQISDEEDAKPQPPPIPVPWKPFSELEHPTSCLGDWRNCLFWSSWLLVTCSNMMRSVGFCWLVRLLLSFCMFSIHVSLVWIHRGATEISCISQTSASSLWLSSRKITQQGRREISRLAWSWAGYSKQYIPWN